MSERKFDRNLHIRTVGLREWGKEANKYNRYEATPYQALEQLFETYSFEPGDQLIDFGCGRGRVVFYVHNRFNIPVTGIEAHDTTFEEALMNEEIYLRNHAHLDAPIQFEFALAEQYEIAEEYNKFFFFNPFSVKIFKQVMKNIMESYKRYPRTIEIILYYPLNDYIHFLRNHTPFELINKIKVRNGEHGSYGRFEIYRLRPEVQDEVGEV
ncbi:MAG TPA: SAM-dependent methyltransferase [Pseudogracilibacillus sp.]|nr:SAM-dependent methyltransferase [Pseudogracilibacillus sp.]